MEIKVARSSCLIEPGQNPYVDNRNLATYYEDNLIVPHSVPKGERTLRIYKLIQQPDGKQKLEFHREIQNLCRFSIYFVFYSSDIKRPVIVCAGMQSFGVYDFETGDLLAKREEQQLLFSEPVSYVLWNNQYLVNNQLQTMRLEKLEVPLISDDDQLVYFFAIHWVGKKLDESVLHMFNIGNHVLLLFLRIGAVQYRTWNEQELSFELHPSFCLERMDTIASQSFFWRDRLILKMQYVSIPVETQYWIYHKNGKFIEAWKGFSPESYLVVWNDFLVEIENPFLPGSTIKFLDHRRKALKQFSVESVKFAFVWRTRLVLFYENKLADVLETAICCCFAAPLAFAPILRSTNKVLSITLEVSVTNVTIGNYTVPASVFNDTFVAPTLSVAPGDTLEILLVNNLKHNLTNLHFHGMVVSPKKPQDDSFYQVKPGTKFQYVVHIPANHPVGLYWYHSHAMGVSEGQLFSGLSGAIDVEGILNTFPPEVQQVDQHIFLLKDTPIKDDEIADSDKIDEIDTAVVTVNGQVNASITVSPGELQLWRFAAVAADRYFLLYLDGNQFYVVATDGHLQTNLVNTSHLLIAPSSRLDVFVKGPPAGTYVLKALHVNTGPEGDDYEEADLLTVVSTEYPVRRNEVEVPTAGFLSTTEDLRNSTIANTRTIIFSEDGEDFLINGAKFDPDRVDTSVDFGTVEEWTIINNSSEMHVFHIHQLYFQVTAINNQQLPFLGFQDTVNLGYSNGTSLSSVTILVPFLDPAIIGKFMYHCHILEHADGGMMATIVVKNSTTQRENIVQNVAPSIQLSLWLVLSAVAGIAFL